jgi:hypothetical protein
MEKVDRSGDSASAKPLDTRIALSEEAWQRDQVYVAPANTGEISVALAAEPKTFQPGSGVTLSRTTNDTGLGISGLVARGADGDTGPSLTTTVYRPGRDPHLNAHEMSYVVNPDHDKNHPPIFSPSFNPPGHRGEPPPNAFPPKITLPDGQVYGGLPVPGQDRPGLPDVPWTGGRGSGTDNGGLNSPGLYPGLLPGGGLNPIEPGSKLPPGNGGEVPGLQPGNGVPGVTVIPGDGGYFPPPKEKPAGTEIPPIKTPVFPGPAGSDNPPVTVPPVATPPISIPQGSIPPKEKPAGTGSGTQIDVPPVQPPVKTPALPIPSGSDNQPAGNKTPVLPRPEVISIGGQVGPKTSSELPPVVVKRPGDVTPPVVSRPSETIPPVVVKPVLPTLPSKGESVIVTQGKPVEAIPPVLKPAQPSDTKPVVVRAPEVTTKPAPEVTAKPAPEVTAKPVIKAIDTTVSWKDVAKSSLSIVRTLETARSAEKAPFVKDVPASAIRVPQKFADAVAAIRADKVVTVKQSEGAAARLPEKFVAAVTAIRAEKVVPVKEITRAPQEKSIVKQEAATPLPQKFTVGNLAAIKAARILPAKETTVAEKQTAKSFVAPAALVRAPHLVVPGKDVLSAARKPATTADSLLTAKTDRTVSQQKPLPTIEKTKSAHTAAPKDFVVKDYAMLQNGLLGKLFQADKTNVRPEGKQQEVSRLHIATKPVADVVVSKALPGRKDAAAGRVEPVDAHRAMRDNVRVLLHEHKHAQTENISRTPATPVSTDKALSQSDTHSHSFSVRFKNDAGETDHRPTRLDLLMAVLAAASAVSRAGRLERKGKKRRLFNESVNQDEVLRSLTIASEILARLNADDADDHTVDNFGDEGQAARIVRRRYMVQPGDSLNSIAGDQLGDEVLAWLLLDINVGAIQHQWNGNICVAEMAGRQEIELPTPEEVAEFYKTRPARRFREKRLVSSVKQTEMDRELVFETFSRVIGRRADEQPA